MNVSVTGTRDGQKWPPAGGEIEVGDQEGADLCAAGLADPVAEPAPAKAEKRTAASRKKTTKSDS